MSQQEISHPLTNSKVKQSFIHPDLQPLPIRLLTKIDIFSFIPVPKDDPVSTRQSLIGTAAFFIIFLTYVIFDFYQFVANNPPNAQNYLTNLPNNMYPLPKFAITFMEGKVLQNCGAWNDYINFTLTQQSKDKGSEFKPVIQMFTNNFTKQNQAENNDSVDWIDGDTKQFYNILRTPSQPLYAKGLLYSMSNASYGKVKIQMCNYSVPEFNCQPRQKIQRFLAGGRVFLFIENIYDTTDFSRQDEENSPHFFIYNFFLEPNNYKRITFNFQVVQTVVSPDFFFRFSTQKQTRLQIQSYIEQSSNVVINDYDLKRQPLDLIGIQFQLSPEILNVKVTYRTLIDHISMWGAFWGVLFAIFAIIFLTYNKKKFYKKNPEWGNFKKNTSKDYNVEEGQVDFGERNSGKMK